MAPAPPPPLLLLLATAVLQPISAPAAPLCNIAGSWKCHIRQGCPLTPCPLCPPDADATFEITQPKNSTDFSVAWGSSTHTSNGSIGLGGHTMLLDPRAFPTVAMGAIGRSPYPSAPDCSLVIFSGSSNLKSFNITWCLRPYCPQPGPPPPPPPASLYICSGSKCVANRAGVPLQECQKICVPGPPPPPLPPPTPSPAPVNTDCITWTKVDVNAGNWTTHSYPDKPWGPLLIVGYQRCGTDHPGMGIGMLLCANLDGWSGHMNYANNGPFYGCEPSLSCYSHDPQKTMSNTFFLGTFAKKNLTWTSYAEGDSVPSNAYMLHGHLIARSADSGNTRHDVIPGYVVPSGGKLGKVQYEDFGLHADTTFELATCHKPTTKPWVCSTVEHQKSCVVSNSTAPVDNKTIFKTQQECAAACIAPPPPPLSTNPCVSAHPPSSSSSFGMHIHIHMHAGQTRVGQSELSGHGFESTDAQAWRGASGGFVALADPFRSHHTRATSC